jgi:transcriptional regulator with XRE-family HTH domain
MKQPVPNFVYINRLKKLRLEKGLTQTQLAVGSNVSLTTVWMIEQGYDRRTKPYIKKRLAKFFKVKPDAIFPVEITGEEYSRIQAEKEKGGK